MHNELLIGRCNPEQPHQLFLPSNIHVQKTQGGREPFILTLSYGLGDVSQEPKERKKKNKKKFEPQGCLTQPKTQPDLSQLSPNPTTPMFGGLVASLLPQNSKNLNQLAIPPYLARFARFGEISARSNEISVGSGEILLDFRFYDAN